MIILKLTGGLGNQMFMYAFARRLQSQTGEIIFISQYELKKNEKRSTKREFALDSLNLPKHVIKLPDIVAEILEHLYKSKYRKFAKSMNDKKVYSEEMFQKAVQSGLYFSEDIYKHYKIPESKRVFKFVTGYFLSYQYFKPIDKCIKKDFIITKEISYENKKLIKKLDNENAVCVHIRLGDYCSSKFRYKNFICDEHYYLEAMDKIYQQIENPIFYIFSTSLEDINYIKKEFHFRYPVNYIELDNPDYAELNLMINCRHFIISNSTFSWWAQYLSNNSDKIVIAPDLWIRDKAQTTKDIYMPKWQLVPITKR